MELAIHTYGHIDSMFYILNGIAMLMNGTFGNSVMMLMTMGSVAYYAMRMSYAGAGDYKAYLGKIMAMVAMVYFMLIPRADMIIYDHVSKKLEKVDNLPLGFALPVGLLESFGDLLTGGFEQVFTAVNNTNYRDYGMVFGARLVQESRNWRIRSPEFMENMGNFIDRCVMVDAMIGYHYTPEDLLKSPDIWSLIKANLSTIRQASMRVGKKRSFMACGDAALVIERSFGLEIDALENKYQKTEIGEAGAANYKPRIFQLGGIMPSQLKNNIAKVFNSYLGSTLNADSLIKQQMMINGLKNYADDYGYARASATQESNWLIAGDLAGTYLPILMSVMKGLVYSSFIFMLPMLIMSGGWGRYLNYLTIVASFQLWAPLNSVLNMFIDVYSSNTLSGIADHIVSFSTMSRIGNYTDKIVAVASGLQMAVPFLAFSLIQGGVSGFIHLAGTITGASQAAASQSANESVTNNKSFDNYSIGNRQSYNQSGFKTDWNESYASGASSYQHSDGTMERVTGNGNTLMQSGIGLTASAGSTTYRQEDSRQAQTSEGIQNAESMHQQDLRSFSNAQSKHIAKASDYVAHLAERETKGDSFAYEKMGEQGESLKQAVSHAKQLHNEKGHSWGQAATVSVETSVSAGLKVAGIGAEINAKAAASAETASEQSVGESTNISQENQTEQNKSNIERALSNSTWAKENSIDQNYSNSVKASYEEVQRAEKQVSISQQKVQDWHEAKNIVDSQGSASSRDMFQEVVRDIQKEYGVPIDQAQKMADRRSPEAQRVWQKIQKEDHYVQNIVDKIAHGKSLVTGDSADAKLDQFTKENAKIIDKDTQNNIKEHAQNNGMNVNNIKNNIQNSQDTLKQKHENIMQKNANEYKVNKDQNEFEQKAAQENFNTLEENKIGPKLGIRGPDNTTKSAVINKGVYENSNNDQGKNT